VSPTLLVPSTGKAASLSAQGTGDRLCCGFPSPGSSSGTWGHGGTAQREVWLRETCLRGAEVPVQRE